MIRRRLCLLFLLTGMTLFAYSQGLLFQANDKEIKEMAKMEIEELEPKIEELLGKLEILLDMFFC